jgi:hydroxylamine reductase
MFCYQCQEAAKGTGCEVRGVCGKTEEVSALQDLLLYTVKGIAGLALKEEISDASRLAAEEFAIRGLFITITNANFDDAAIAVKIYDGLAMRNALEHELRDAGGQVPEGDLYTWNAVGRDALDAKASANVVGVLATENEDVRSLRELVVYGLKGIAAYADHAINLGKVDRELQRSMLEALVATTEEHSVDELVALTLKTGADAVTVMSLLDAANTGTYGNPEITEVNIGTQNNPAILVSGHDLKDLEQLLEQTMGTGVDVYTHGEMLPAHYYPEFKKYDNLIGNYGNAWWKQKEEFESFGGPVLFTTNCIVPPKDENVSKIYTTGASGYPGSIHILADESGIKDFSQIIEHAKKLPAPIAIEEGSIVGGFAHAQVVALADTVVDAVKSGAIRKFFVMAGCDGRQKSRNYYTEFAEKLPEDTVILTAGCAKYRYNKLDLGDIGGIPRVLDAGQCNDSYSLVAIAMKLQEVFELDDINDLPIVYNIAWYEQKAVTVLLALLALGVKNIHLGPTLPAFLSPNVVNVLVENFGIAPMGTVDADLELFLG